jgi:hypothetical protein
MQPSETKEPAPLIGHKMAADGGGLHAQSTPTFTLRQWGPEDMET